MTPTVLALAGGVGGAKLAVGLAKVLPPERLTIVVNTGDDEVFHGLHVSPDLDTMMYALAGLTNTVTGWGVAGDTFNGLALLRRYGADTWFNLGDKDLATHIRRTQLLREGGTLSQATESLCRSLGILHRVVPMSDAALRTVVETGEGALAFQDYFVKHRCEPVAKAVRFEDGGGRDVGSTGAVGPSPAFLGALDEASVLVYCPSNPFLSIAPVLALKGVRERVRSFQGPRVAVSPIVGREALRGPAAKLLAELGYEVSCRGVAEQYAGLCDVFVIDEVDRDQARAVEALGMRVVVAPTVMISDVDKERLARRILDMVGGANSEDGGVRTA
ncbi:MAG: 2-phospho-L-lactate transferase [Dehalococcoidia bacterium]|nr:2-phospho-L-lactate transferase [Dehalococcoidia bacterium]